MVVKAVVKTWLSGVGETDAGRCKWWHRWGKARRGNSSSAAG